MKNHIYNPYSSWSKKESVAKYYSKEGNMSLIVKSIVKPDLVLCDLERLSKQIKNDPVFKNSLLSGSLDYMIKDKEVIVKEPINSKIEIIYIKGRL